MELDKVNTVPPQMRAFLQTSGPFDQLPQDVFNSIVNRLSVVYLTEDIKTQMLQQHPSALFVIQSGQFSVRDGHGPLEHLSEGDYFGFKSLLLPSDKGANAGKPSLHISVDSPGVVLICDESDFLICMRQRPFAQFFEAASQNSLSSKATNDSNSQWLYKKLADIVTRQPIVVRPSDSIQTAAEIMRKERVSSLLVTLDDALVGIVTDRDLRNRVVATGMNTQLPVKQIMTESPFRVSRHRTLFDAVSLMSEHNIHHLPVVDSATNQPTGMITATDVFRHQKSNVLFLIGDLTKAETLYDLTRSAWQIPHYFNTSGRRLGDLDIAGKVMGQATDVMTRKLIDFFCEKTGPAPMAWCWLVYGSQAREDQTLGSDQDNSLLLERTPNEQEAEYFRELAEYVCQGLGKCGIKLCDGNIMASNPNLRMSVDDAVKRAKHWVKSPTPEAILNFNIFLDVRAVAGNKDLFQQMQERRSPLWQDSNFLAALARQTNEVSVPLSMFQRFQYEKDGERKDLIDLKKNAVAILNNIVRIYALSRDVRQAQTIVRLDNLPADCGLSERDRRNLKDIWLFINRLRWRHQLTNKVTDNKISISDLSSIEKHQLKAAFQAIHNAQQALVLKFSGGIG